LLDSKQEDMLDISITSPPALYQHGSGPTGGQACLRGDRLLVAGSEPCWYRAGKPACLGRVNISHYQIDQKGL